MCQAVGTGDSEEIYKKLSVEIAAATNIKRLC